MHMIRKIIRAYLAVLNLVRIYALLITKNLIEQYLTQSKWVLKVGFNLFGKTHI